jgi:GGDEF domain-containing protein
VRVPYGGALIQPTCSGGAAIARAGDTAESLLRRADAGLYESKRAGRNRIAIA